MRSLSVPRLVAALALSVSLTHPAVAANVTWVGGTGSWNVATNWSSNPVLPAAADDVTINVAGVQTITHGSGVDTINSLSMPGDDILSVTGASLTVTSGFSNAANTTIAGGTLVLNGASTMGSLTLSSGTLSGSGTIVVSGASTWAAGVMSGTGTTQFDGTFAITGPNIKLISGGRTLTLNATTNWTGNTANGNNAISFSNGTINNAGTFNDANGFDSQLAANGAFNNSGTYTKTGSGTTLSQVAFNNTGTVNVNAGRLEVQTGTSTGTFNLANGAALEFRFGLHTLNSATIQGAGTLEIGGGTAQINGGTYTAPLLFSSGFISGTGATFTAPAQWTGGTITGAGTTVFDNTLDITGPSGKTISGTRVVTLNGTTTWSGNTGVNSNVIVFSNGTLNNAGTFNDTNAFNTFMDTGGVTTFNNSGTYNKSPGVNSTTVIEVPFNNTGTVNVNAGRLHLQGGTGSGTFTIAGGATLDFVFGTHTLNTATVSGAGTFEVGGGNVVINGGTYSAPLLLSSGSISGTTSTFTAPARWTGGTIGGPGTTTFDNSLQITGPDGKAVTGTRVVNLKGTTTWGGNTAPLNNTIAWNNGTINNTGTFNDTNQFNSLMDTLGVNAFNNSGTYNKTGNATTTIEVPFNNTGAVNVSTGRLHLQGGTGSGAFTIAGGATLDFVFGTHTLNNATIAGAGTLEVGGGNLVLNDGTYSAPLLLSSGSISGTTSTFTAPAVWTGGTIGGPGTTTFNNNLDIAGPNGKGINGTRVVNLNGTTTWRDNTAALNNGIFWNNGTVNNAGTFNDTNAFNGLMDTLGATLFNNTGTYNKLGNATTSIEVTFQNSGTVNAQAGVLAIFRGVQGPTGTIQIGPNGALDIGAGVGGASTVGTLLHNGTGATSLQLNLNNITVFTDYNNASFGVGNSFNARANVAGTGQIRAAGDVAQAIVGPGVSGGGTATPTLTIGNVHVGANTISYQVANSGTSGPSLRGAIQTINGGNITDARLSGSGVTPGNWGPVAPGTTSGNLDVVFTAQSSGALAPLVGQTVHVVNNFANVGSQNLTIVLGGGAAAYNLAAGNATPSPVSLPDQRIGGTATQALTVTNTAPAGAFTEVLNASFGASTGNAVNNAGAISGGLNAGGVAGGGSNATAMSVAVDTSAAGLRSGTVSLNYVSNGSGTSGLGNTSVGSQTINVSGNVFQAAAGQLNNPTSLNFGTVQVGQVVSQAASISNVATGPAGFVEDLNASFGAATGTGASRISGTGSVTGLVAGQTDSTSMVVSVDTSSAGTVNGSIPINFFTAGAVNGASNTLGTAAVGSASFGVVGTIETVAQVVDQAKAVINTPTVDLGNVRINTASPTQLVSVTNQATGNPQAALNASISGNAPVTASGSFTQLAPGGTNASSLQVGIDTSSAGHRSGTATVALVSDASNVGGCAPNCQVTLPSQHVNVSANVFRLANPVLVNNGLITVSRVGAASGTTAINITNLSPDAFTEGLNVTRGATPAGFTSSGSITNLAAGGTSSTIQISLDTATAGIFGGNQELNFVSTGAGTTGAPDVAVGTGNVALSGKVYQTAQAQLNTGPINFGTVHVGDTVAPRSISVTNAAPVTALNDVLVGSVGVGPGAFSASGTLGAGLAAGQTDSSSLKVALNTSSAGVFTGQADLALASHNADLADVPLSSPITLQAQVNNFANPVFSRIGGDGTFTGSGLAYVLDLGAIASVLGPVTANLALANALIGGPQDALGGGFSLPLHDFVTTGFQPFAGLEAGQSLTGLNVAFDPSGRNPGDFSEVIILHPFGSNESGFFGLPDVVVTVQATVFIETPEPGTGLLIAAGVIALVGLYRRRGRD